MKIKRVVRSGARADRHVGVLKKKLKAYDLPSAKKVHSRSGGITVVGKKRGKSALRPKSGVGRVRVEEAVPSKSRGGKRRGEDLRTLPGLEQLTPAQVEYLSKSLPAVLRRITQLFGSERDGVPDIPPEELGRIVAQAVPVQPPRSKMAEFVGPQFYSTNGVAAVLAPAGSKRPITKQAVEQRRDSRTLLALRTSDKRWIYPTWQFVDHQVMEGLPQLLAVFRGHPEWSVAVWLRTAAKELGGRRPVDCLAAESDRHHVMAVARQTAARWAA